MNPFYAWAISIMTALQPPAETPWADTYPATAIAIVDEGLLHPIFPGADGGKQTIALDLSVAWYESRFRVDAEGDGGRSHGLFQIQTWGGLKEPELHDPELATPIAHRLFLVSFRNCAARPWAERLAWYADGGMGCGREGPRGELARKKSAHRMALAARILKDFPLDDAPMDDD